jgi:hypothetical protein
LGGTCFYWNFILDTGLPAIPVLADGAHMKTLTIIAVALVAGSFLQAMPIAGNEGFFRTVSAQENWKMEFDQVCSKTQDAMVFNPEELRSLIRRCDTLKPVIEKLDESHRKVTLKRLQMCRDLYQFVLEAKEGK